MTEKAPTFAPGSTVVVRHLVGGRVFSMLPVRVVADTGTSVAYYVRPDTRWLVAVDADGRRAAPDAPGWTLTETVWHTNEALWLWRAPDAHAAVCLWTGTPRRFAGWYVNLQDPLRRVADGFESTDHELDIVVDPGVARWRWKDLDVFERLRANGFYDSAMSGRVLDEGYAVIERITNHQPPFDEGWEDWAPPAAWPVETPRLPASVA
jgi:hypothetical protein